MGYVKSSVLVAGLLACALTLGAVPREAEAQLCSKPKKGCVVTKDIKKNAVDSSRVKNNSLKGADIKDGTLTGADVKNNSLTGTNVKDKSLSGAAVQDGGIEAADLAPGAEKDTLADLNCTVDQVARFIDGAWECVTGGASYAFISTLTTAADAGVAAMDAQCQGDATAAGLPAGTYRAWLSTDAFNARDMLPPGPFFLPDGTILALSKADLLDGSVLATINVLADGNPLSTSTSGVWTGTKSDGTHSSGRDCDGWNTSSNIFNATVGLLIAQDDGWTDNGFGLCAASLFLYCIQVQ